MSGSYVTDITHYLDDSGDLAEMPDSARQLASFLTLMIDAATQARLGHVSRTRVTQIMNLLTLAPDIQEALLFLTSVDERFRRHNLFLSCCCRPMSSPGRTRRSAPRR